MYLEELKKEWEKILEEKIRDTIEQSSTELFKQLCPTIETKEEFKKRLDRVKDVDDAVLPNARNYTSDLMNSAVLLRAILKKSPRQIHAQANP